MPWYAAHIIEYARFFEGEQDYYPLYENVVLIEASTEEEARARAYHIGQAEYDDSERTTEGLVIDGRPATWVFAGVRKVIMCQYHLFDKQPADETAPRHGSEVTYSRLKIANEAAFRSYVNGGSVDVHYEE
ncbi:MAG: DUF4288 domain-containing protein [Chloroflexaceae bacterium]|nr:DUF4288 domain-containing protein [Chloroflexaceae bacterium]NJO05500.1 DUF4288 domain-containing protein [Chloroflexaceae bacterium]